MKVPSVLRALSSPHPAHRTVDICVTGLEWNSSVPFPLRGYTLLLLLKFFWPWVQRFGVFFDNNNDIQAMCLFTPKDTIIHKLLQMG